MKADRVDNVISIKGKRTAVKVDVEGHELSALEGMRALFSDNECYVQVESLREDRVGELRQFMMSIGYSYVFSLRDDHLFLAPSLKHLMSDVLAIISDAVSADLRHLVVLRREKRTIALAARKLREAAGYRKDPLYLGRDESPF